MGGSKSSKMLGPGGNNSSRLSRNNSTIGIANKTSSISSSWGNTDSRHNSSSWESSARNGSRDTSKSSSLYSVGRGIGSKVRCSIVSSMRSSGSVGSSRCSSRELLYSSGGSSSRKVVGRSNSLKEKVSWSSGSLEMIGRSSGC